MGRKARCMWLPFLAVAAVCFTQSTALAAGLTLGFDGAANTQPPFTNPGAPPVDQNFFVGDFNLANGSTITLGGNINAHLHVSTAIGISDSFDGSFPISTTTAGLALQNGGIHINSTPTGGATLTLWDQQTGGNDPGGDGGNPNSGAVMPSVLTNADLTNLHSTLVGPGQSPTGVSNPIALHSNGSISTSILGIPITLPATADLTGNVTAGVDHIGYAQTSGDGLLGPGAQGGNPNIDQTSQYLMNFNPIGNLDGAINTGISGNVNISVLGIGLGSQSINFSAPLPLVTALGLPGVATLADLNPTGYDTVHHDDLQVTLGLNNGNGGGILGIDFPLATNGLLTVTFSTVIVNNGGLTAYTMTADVTATLTYGVLATLQAANVGYQLQDSFAGVVAPEPGSIVLLFLGLAGALPFVIRRIRKR